MKTAVSTTFIFTAVLLAVMVIAGLFTSRELLALIHTPDDIMDASLLYLNIYIYGLPFMFFSPLSVIPELHSSSLQYHPFPIYLSISYL